MNSSCYNGEVSTKPGQLQSSPRGVSFTSATRVSFTSALTPVIDLGYRKRTHVIAAIKGERRRSAIRDAFDADRVTPLDAFYATPTLPDEHRRALGRLHPSFMGKDRIRYRVVDEYNGDTLTEKRTRSSKRPSSEFYPQFKAGIRVRIAGWYGEGERLNCSD